MSYAEILGVFPGTTELPLTLAEMGNSHRGAPLVWYAMAQEYMELKGDKAFSIMHDNVLGDRVWKLAENKEIPAAHRAVLMMTFDRAYVMRKDFPQAARDIDEFISGMPLMFGAGHWPTIRLAFEKGGPVMPELRTKVKVPAFGFWHTSVISNPFLGPWNEEKDDHDPFD